MGTGYSVSMSVCRGQSVAAIPSTEERRSSPPDSSTAASPAPAPGLLHDPSNAHSSHPLRPGQAGMSSALVCPRHLPCYPFGLGHLTSPHPLAPGSLLEILTSYSLLLAVPRDHPKWGFLERKDPLLYENLLSIRCSQRLT